MKSASKNQVINNILARTNFHKMTERSNEERLRILQERLAQINQKGVPSNQSISAYNPYLLTLYNDFLSYQYDSL